MCSNCERIELLKENVPNVEETTNLQIVMHLERHTTSVKEKSLEHMSLKKWWAAAYTNSEETEYI